MAGTKEIRTKIKSIKNTQKITKAMEMVAASKMRRAQERMFATKPYAQKIRQVVAHLACGHSEFHHPFLESREIQRVGIIIITTDRGLCGGLNVNLLKNTLLQIREWRQKNIEVDLALIGTKAEAFFKRFGGNVVASAAHLGDKPEVQQLIGIINVMLKAYEAKKIDALYLSYNDFINTMTQRPILQQLLPITVENVADTEDLKYHWDYIYEPDAKSLVDMLLTRYIESQVYQSVVENTACEQAARMVAMKNASDNAGNLISELQLVYNKARQAAITQELSEIIAGAAAV